MPPNQLGAGSPIPSRPPIPPSIPSRRKRILKGGTLLTGATRLTNLRGFVVRRNGESAYLRLAVLVRTARFHARAHDTAARVGFGDISRAADINFVIPGARCGARNTRRIVDLPKWPHLHSVAEQETVRVRVKVYAHTCRLGSEQLGNAAPKPTITATCTTRCCRLIGKGTIANLKISLA